jgi:parvulin-like peptidyl-prolyl isomerase
MNQSVSVESKKSMSRKDISSDESSGAAFTAGSTENTFEIRDDILWAISNSQYLKTSQELAIEFQVALSNALAQTYLDVFMRSQKASDLELQKKYLQYKNHLGSKEFKIRIMTLESINDAYSILREFRRQRDFSLLAKQYSRDGFSNEGGLVGWVAEGALKKETSASIKLLKLGEASPPISTEDGVHILLVEEVRDAKPATFSVVKPALEEAYATEMLGEHLTELRRARRAAAGASR